MPKSGHFSSAIVPVSTCSDGIVAVTAFSDGSVVVSTFTHPNCSSGTIGTPAPPLSQEELCRMIYSRPSAAEVRAVSETNYFHLSVNQEKDAVGGRFSLTPSSVEYLELFGNHLFDTKFPDVLAADLRCLPSGIKTLGLGYNNLLCLPERHWGTVFNALPRHVTALDLRGNNLARLHQAEPVLEVVSLVKKLLIAMPIHIHFIDLSENGLEKLPETALDELRSVVSAGTSVRMGYCPDGRGIDIEGRKVVLPSLTDAAALRALQQRRISAHLPAAPLPSSPVPAARLPDVSSAVSRRGLRAATTVTIESGLKTPQPPLDKAPRFFPPVSPLAGARPTTRSSRTSGIDQPAWITPGYKPRWS